MTEAPEPTSPRTSRAIGALFVLLWSTGFIGAKLGLPYAGPMTFLVVRMSLAAALLLAIAVVTKARWPHGRRAWLDVTIAGLLVHCGYLGGVFSAIHQGLSAGIVALIVGVQPLLTAIVAIIWLRERASARQWLGLALGALGVALVVSGSWASGHISALGIGLAVAALISITAGTLYQKRFGGAMDFRTGGAIQYAVTGLALLPIAITTESMVIIWTTEFVIALAWLILVLSVGAVSVLYFLIKRGRMIEVSSLFYLTPPTTAVMAFLLFDEKLAPTALIGMTIAVLGVALVTARRGRILA